MKTLSFKSGRPCRVEVHRPSPLSRWTREFDHELELVERAYRTAIAEMLNDRVNLTSEDNTPDQTACRGDQDDFAEVEWEECDYQHDVDISELLYEIDTTVRLITESFIIALWHFWERQLLRAPADGKTQGKDKQYDHTKSFAWLKDKGFSPDGRQLRNLKLLAETLKHHFGKSANELYRAQPDHFIDFDAERIAPSSYQLDMTPARFEAYLEVVRHSGPSGPTV